MTSGVLQDPLPSSSSSSTSAPRFRPYASSKHQVMKGRYITSNDPRGYIPVYEYPLNGQWIMMDIDDGYILWTGIWKALGNSKADIVKMIDSQPDLAPLIRRVRGGYLKIQGTWMPYEVALRLSRRVAWAIREDLIPLFGPTFPSTCLSPDQPGYGQVVASNNNRRRTRRNTTTTVVQARKEPNHPNWTVVTPSSDASPPQPALPSPHLMQGNIMSPSCPDRYHLAASSSGPSASKDSVSVGGQNMKYGPLRLNPPVSSHPSISVEIPGAVESEPITLPPLRGPSLDYQAHKSPYALPPISALEDLRGVHTNDSVAVLKRLQSDDEPPIPNHTYPSTAHHNDYNSTWPRGRSLTVENHSRNSEDSPRRYPNSFPTYSQSHGPHPYNDYYRPRKRPSPPSSCSRGSPQLSQEEFSTTSTCEPSPTSPSTPRSAFSSPPLTSRYREDSGSGMVPLTIAADRIHLDPASESERRQYERRYPANPDNVVIPPTKYSECESRDRRQPLRPW